MELFKATLVAFTATLFCIHLLKPLAHRIGFVDRPGGRKHHENEIPLIGGVSMFFGFCFALLSLHISLQPYRGLIAGCGLLVMMGVVDDFKELSSKLRLFGQLFAALFLIVWGHELVSNLGNLLFNGNLGLGLYAFPFTVVMVMAFINALNMIDGQDGLAGGVALTQIVLLGVVSVMLKQTADLTLLAIIAVLLIVFLSFNLRLPWRKRASIFMGDSGSTFLAFLIAWFAIHLSQVNVSVINPVAVLWILAFPLFDLIAVMIYRIRRGISPLSAGRNHIHHVLHVAGISAGLSTLLLCVFSLLLGAAGLLLNHWHVREPVQLITLLFTLLCYLIVVRMMRAVGAETSSEVRTQ